MRFYIGVENFAKIESAEICVNQYTLLVGPNNSGKTFLMQLAEGVNDYLEDLIDEEALNELPVRQENKYVLLEFTKDSVANFTKIINKHIAEKKEDIVRTLLGTDVAVGKLYINIEFEKEEGYRIYRFTNIKDAQETLPEIQFLKKISSNSYKGSIGVLQRADQAENGGMLSISIGLDNNAKWEVRHQVVELLRKKSLFMPASRNGLMMLYREFFAHKTDDYISFTVNGSKIEKQNKGISGLTQPVYNFLRFLQTYNYTNSRYDGDRYKEELEFYDNQIIEGHIKINEQGTLAYLPKEEKISVPLHLVSSMVNEVAPLYMAITSDRIYDRLIIDEIEASLHPEKQMKLVRFLNRLYNDGIHFIISTHSDTFVSKLNNLCVLSEYVKRTGNDDALRQLSLTAKDVIPLENLYVYEFINHSDGKSTVKEISFNEKLGYQFDLFTDSALRLYNEAAQIQEIVNNEC